MVAGARVFADEPKPLAKEKVPVREIFVPYEDLHVLLQGDPKHVFLTREQYQDLLTQAKAAPPREVPESAYLVSAHYDAVIETGRARISGQLLVEVLEEGLHAIPFPMERVGVRQASLDGSPAAIAKREDGTAVLFVEGIGRKQLQIEMIAPLSATAAEQSLEFRIPTPAATRFRLTVPGAAELIDGAKIIRRSLDEAANVTRFELLPRNEVMKLALKLNRRKQREQRVIVARSVLVAEITEGYERLHTTLSLGLMHGSEDEFRVRIPAGFEVNSVSHPLLARFSVEEQDESQIVTIVLREPASESVLLRLTATKTEIDLDNWSMPRLEPLDVAGHASIVGVVVEDRLQLRSLAAQGLLPIDHEILSRAIPDSVFAADASAPQIKLVAAYYAPQAVYELTASLSRPALELEAISNVLVSLREERQSLRGHFRLWPKNEKLFDVDVLLPPAWHLTEPITVGGEPLAHETYTLADGTVRTRMRLPRGVDPGNPVELVVQAEHVPLGWLGTWEKKSVPIPNIRIENASSERGALAVQVAEDWEPRPDELRGLTPLDEDDKALHGLGNVSTDLAYRFEEPTYGGTILLQRKAATLTARSYSFLKIQPEGLSAHYEIVYDIGAAKTRRLAFQLPGDAPTAISIRGLEGVDVKEFSEKLVDDVRRWTVLTDKAQRGRVRLAVDFQQPLIQQQPKDFALPLVVADEVQYQTGVVAVEGHVELDIEVKTKGRKADVGKLAGADYRIGRRILGAYEFLGPPQDVRIDVFRRPGYELPPAIVERAELVSLVSTSGRCQTAARYVLRTKSPYLEVRLPDRSKLWSILLDGESTKPQREAESLLVAIASGDARKPHDLQVIYESPIRVLGGYGRLQKPAPKLFLREGGDNPISREVPVANLVWHLDLPAGHRVVRENGTVFTSSLGPRPPAAWRVAARLTGKSTPPFAHVQNATRSMDATFDRGSRSMRGRRRSPLGAIEGDTSGYATLDKRSGHRYGDADVNVDDLFDRKAGDGQDDLPQMAGEPAAPAGSPELPAAVASANTRSPGNVLGVLSFDGNLNLNGNTLNRAASQTGETADFDVLSEGTTVEITDFDIQADNFGEGGQPPLTQRLRNLWALSGVGSLKIDLASPVSGERVTFHSLGMNPHLTATIVDGSRLRSLAWSVGLTVGLLGLLVINRTTRFKLRLVVAVLVAATVIPLLSGLTYELGEVCDAAFYAGCLLIPLYLFVGFCRWVGRRLSRHGAMRSTVQPAGAAATAVVLGFAAMSTVLFGQTDLDGNAPWLQPPEPVTLPVDAVIIPYNADDDQPLSDQSATKILVPYDTYVELWNRAHPDDKIGDPPRVADYSLAGATFETSLEGDEHLAVTGWINIEQFTDDEVTIPLPLGGGVLTRAVLDGKPARLSVMQLDKAATAAQPAESVNQQAEAELPAAILALQTTGRGTKRLEISIRLRLVRRGGWRIAEGRLPAAVATSLNLRVPAARTEVQLDDVYDQRRYETESAEEVIETTLRPSGQMRVRWRPLVASAVVDHSLTADSKAVFDIEEDGLRLAWQIDLRFPRSRRSSFVLQVPKDYLIERVAGRNVRHWEARVDGENQRVDVSLLKEVEGRESLTVVLSRRDAVGQSEFARFATPLVMVADAALHRGVLQVRRSGLLDVRALVREGLTRTDASEKMATSVVREAGYQASPLELRPFQAFRFASTPFQLQLEAVPVAARTSTEVQTVLQIEERQVGVESRVQMTVQDRPLYRFRMSVPDDLELTRVTAPGTYEWAVEETPEHRVLTVFFAAGHEGELSLVLAGKIPREDAEADVRLPRLQVLDVPDQRGAMAVVVDPAFHATAAELKQCEVVLRERVHSWLGSKQRELAQLAISYRTHEYQGLIRVTAKQPQVRAVTVSNIRVTEHTIEETIFLDFQVANAGVRKLRFLVPERFRKSRLEAKLLRQKIIRSLPQNPEGYVQFELELQDAVLGQVQVLMQHDRLLSLDDHTAPIPVVQTGQTHARFVVLESAGRDEVVVDELDDLEPLSRSQSQQKILVDLLGDGISTAYLARSDSETPRLKFRVQQRMTVQTVGARIGKAETVLVFDGSGAYRARLEYRVNNDTEQFLEILLPTDSELWTAAVADEPVKPTLVPGATDTRCVRIPLIKTAEGDLDFPVVLKYGGRHQLGIGKVIQFPLVQTVNIKAELSQVRLRLPRTHKWFRFGGSMTPVADEGAYRVGDVIHLTNQLRMLNQGLLSKNPFTRIRCANNMKQIGLAIQDFESGISMLRLDKNRELKKQIAINDAVRKQAGDRLAQVAEEHESDTGRLGNRLNLRGNFDQQKNTFSENTLSGMESNFRGASIVPKEAPQGQRNGANRFNQDWLDQNSLSTNLAVEGQSELRFQPNDQAKKEKSKDQLPTAAVPPFGSDVDAKPDHGVRSENGRGRILHESKVSEESDLDRYEQQLKSNSPRLESLRRSRGGGGFGGGRDGSGGVPTGQKPASGRGSRVTRGEPRSDDAGDGRMSDDGGRGPRGTHSFVDPQSALSRSQSTPGQVSEVGGHLASLDVNLPLEQAGVEYFFTAPQSEIEITARTVSSSLIDRGVKLVWVASILLTLAILRRVAQWFVLTARGIPAGVRG